MGGVEWGTTLQTKHRKVLFSSGCRGGIRMRDKTRHPTRLPSVLCGHHRRSPPTQRTRTPANRTWNLDCSHPWRRLHPNNAQRRRRLSGCLGMAHTRSSCSAGVQCSSNSTAVATATVRRRSAAAAGWGGNNAAVGRRGARHCRTGCRNCRTGGIAPAGRGCTTIG